MLSTYSQSFNVFSTNCPSRMCNTPSRFDFSKYNTTGINNTLVDETTTRVNSLPLGNIRTYGLQMHNLATFNFKETNVTVGNMEFLAVSAISDVIFGTDY